MGATMRCSEPPPRAAISMHQIHRVPDLLLALASGVGR